MDAGEYLRGLFLSRRQHPDATGKSLECVTEGDSDLRLAHWVLKYPLKTKFLR